MKVLVAGGTGRLGSLLVHDLAERDVQVRVMTRERKRARHLEGVADIVTGDVRRPDTLSRAVSGVDVVVSAFHGFAGPGRVTPASVDRDGNFNLFDSAAREGSDVVMVSVYGAAPDSPMDLFRCKWEAEQYLKGSPIPWTIVQATAFIELWASLMRFPIVFGRGENPINFVAAGDVAGVVRSAVLDPDTRGQVLKVAGPENLTFNELAALLSQMQGRTRRLWHVPRPVLRALAPWHRQPRAALAMDTLDMTAVLPPPPGADHPTSLREVLSGLAAV